MSLPKRILVATDFSSHAERAGEVGIAWAERLGADLHWTHAVPRLPEQLPPSAAPLVTSHVEQAEHEGRDALERCVASARKGGIESESHLVEAPAAAGIVALAERIDADCIVVGSRGHGRFQNLLLGSVAERVVRDAACRVLVVRGEGDPTAPATIVLGDDLSDISTPARDTARDLARALGASLDVVHAPDLGIPGFRLARMGLPDRVFDDLRVDACERIDALMRGDEGLDVAKVVTQDEPAHAVCAHARQVGAGLAVVGTRSPSDIERALFGSVAGRVVRHADCSVLVVR
ncbi:MAG: universal stress protein [Myxococcota bacterium]